jgi:hypothetical protein
MGSNISPQEIAASNVRPKKSESSTLAYSAVTSGKPGRSAQSAGLTRGAMNPEACFRQRLGDGNAMTATEFQN